MDQADGRALLGQRVLIVEDQVIVAIAMSDILKELGAVVIGPALTLRDADALARSEEIDIALLDLWIHGVRSYAIGEVLQQRGIPFLLTSAADRGTEPPSFRDVPRIMKPFMPRELIEALRGAAGPQASAA